MVIRLLFFQSVQTSLQPLSGILIYSSVYQSISEQLLNFSLLHYFLYTPFHSFFFSFLFSPFPFHSIFQLVLKVYFDLFSFHHHFFVLLTVVLMFSLRSPEQLFVSTLFLFSPKYFFDAYHPIYHLKLFLTVLVKLKCWRKISPQCFSNQQLPKLRLNPSCLFFNGCPRESLEKPEKLREFAKFSSTANCALFH